MSDPCVVLVPLDGSREATFALPIARALAGVLEASLHVLHVASDPATLTPRLASAMGLDSAEARDVVVDGRLGEPAEEIARAAEEWGDTVIVLCSRTGASGDRGALGPVAAGVIAVTRHPVVVVPANRGAVPWALRTMLIPHEGMPAVASKLARALDLARRSAANVFVLHVASPNAPPECAPGALAGPRYLDQQHHEWPAWAEEFVERLAMHAPVRPRTVRAWLVRGEPASAIRAFAAEHEADLVVLCSRCTLEPGRAAVVQGVLRDACTPVLVLRYG